MGMYSIDVTLKEDAKVTELKKSFDKIIENEKGNVIATSTLSNTQDMELFCKSMLDEQVDEICLVSGNRATKIKKSDVVCITIEFEEAMTERLNNESV